MNESIFRLEPFQQSVEFLHIMNLLMIAPNILCCHRGFGGIFCGGLLGRNPKFLPQIVNAIRQLSPIGAVITVEFRLVSARNNELGDLHCSSCVHVFSNIV